MTEPLVSVLMPVYNVEKYIREAMDGVVQQTFEDFEFVIVDDCSTDGTVAIVEEYAARDPRIRLTSTPRNMGHTAALNLGLDETKGEFVARMDGDDVTFPPRFDLQLAYLQKHPECVALGTQVEFMDEEGDFLVRLNRQLAHEDIETNLMRGDCLAMVHPTVMFRRDVVMAIGKYDSGLKKGEDHDLYLRLAEHGRLANLPEVMLRVRRFPTSTTALSTQEEMIARTRDTIRRARERRGLPPDPIELDSFPQMQTRAQWHADWAMSLHKRNEAPRVARKHTWRALRHGFFTYEAWRAVFYVFMGPAAVIPIRSFVRMLTRRRKGEPSDHTQSHKGKAAR